MFFKLHSATLNGVYASIIDVEVDLKKGLPGQAIVGLPDPAVREARERVNAAIRNSGYDFPLGSLTVNLAPASLKKVGSIFDLAIALGILIVSSALKAQIDIHTTLVVGELSLDGHVRPVRGVLAVLEQAIEGGFRDIVLPSHNYDEARLFHGPRLHPVMYLKDAVSFISGSDTKIKPDVNVKYCSEKKPAGEEGLVNNTPSKKRHKPDFCEVVGQNFAIRGAEIAAAGGHNILFIGSPGSGKTMIASRIPTILPDMSEKESFETTKIYSIAGMLPAGAGLVRVRPFRAPHHTASDVSIIGGGRNAVPGEITLSNNGVLFLDEFTEFKSNIIQSLRQPLESGSITISRAESRLNYPAHFMLVASMNPCPCGYLFDDQRNCRCSVQHIQKYFMKLSGPILDRIDIQVQVKSLKAHEIVRGKLSVSSREIKKHVIQARNIQYRRLGRFGIHLNSEMDSRLVKRFCTVHEGIREILYQAVQKYDLSARAYYRILKVARTVADIEGREDINERDILEVLSYREVESILYCSRVNSHPG